MGQRAAWGSQQRKVARYLQEHEPQTARTIAEALNMDQNYVRAAARRLGIKLPHTVRHPVSLGHKRLVKLEQRVARNEEALDEIRRFLCL